MASRKSPIGTPHFRLFFSLFFAAFMILAATSPARSATITVENTDDSGAGSLRNAIGVAAAGDDIDAQGVSGTITLTSGYLEIEQNLTIIGPSGGGLSVSGNNSDRVFAIQGGTVTLSNLTIQDGSVSDGGGGIYNVFGADLSLSNCTISGNAAATKGGGISNEGTLQMENCTVSGNSVLNALGNGGYGGGIYSNSNSSLVLTNCTVSENAVPNANSCGGGIYNGDVGVGITLTNCTVTQNTALDGAGYYSFASVTGITVKNTILSGNTGNSDIWLQESTTVSESYNLVGTDASSLFTSTDDIFSGSPGLSPLADNGGPTWTHALELTSPALDAGTSVGAPSTDQRGESRPQDGNSDGVAVVDIGAYEYVPTPVSGCDSDVPPSAHGQHVAGSTVDKFVQITLSGSDQDDEALTYEVVSGPSHGTLTGTPPALTYNWDGGPAVTDSFTFRVNDGCHNSSTATVNVEMLQPLGGGSNEPPIPHLQVLKGNSTTMNITLSASDHDNDPLTYEVVSGPSHGTLTGTPPNLIYQTTLTSGTDIFYFRVMDNRTDLPRYSEAVSVYIYIGEGFKVDWLPPVADAGPDQEVKRYASEGFAPEGPWSTTLDGSKSYDPAGRTLSYLWECPGGGGGALGVIDPNSEKTEFESNNEATYNCTLTVTNSDDQSATDSVEVRLPAYDSLALALLAGFCALVGVRYVRRGARENG